MAVTRPRLARASLGACTSGSENVAVGGQSCLYLTTGVMNVGFGVQSMQNVTTGSYNTGIGTTAPGGITTGGNNTGVGRGAGWGVFGGAITNALATGSFCTFLGCGAAPSSTTQLNYATVIGAGAIGVVQSNSITLGRIGTDVVYQGVSVVGASNVAGDGYTVSTCQPLRQH